MMGDIRRGRKWIFILAVCILTGGIIEQTVKIWAASATEQKEDSEQDSQSAGESDAEENQISNSAQEAEEYIIEPQELEEKSSYLESEMMEDMELEQVQEAIDELLGEEAFSLTDAVTRLLNGEEVLTKDYLETMLENLFFSQFNAQKKTILNIVLLVLVAALFTNFSNVFENGHIAEISFYMVYLLMLALLIRSFGSISSDISQTLSNLTIFMKALAPAYFIAVVAATGAGSAALFYEMVLILIYLVQVILLSVILPGINVYVLLELVNFLHKEDFLSKMAELLRMLIEWSLKTCSALVIGLQVVQSMLAPAIDSLKRTFLGKTAGAIPGIGNAMDAVAEVVLGTAALVRNCLGVAAIVVLVLICVSPFVKLGIITLLYKFLAALTQPISDKRMVGCLNTVGEGCILLIKVLATTEILFIITIAILTTSFFSHA